MKHLLDLSGLINPDDTYKALRASQVKNSEINVPKVIDAVENLYLSPFNLELQCSNNYSFSSGKMFEGDIDDLLKIQQQGKETAHKFFEERIFSFRVSFHDTIQTIKPSLFGDEFFETQQKKQSSEILKTSRDVLGKLLWLSARYEKSINFFEALKCPLCPIPLSLALLVGTKQSTQKSKLISTLAPTEQANDGNGKTSDTLW